MMKAKRSLITHACWFVVAVAAMGLGWKMKSHANAVAGSGTRDDGRSAKSSRGLQGSSGGEAGVSGPASRSAGNRSVTGKEPGVRLLSSAEIEELGEKFRTTASPIERRLAFSRLLEGLTAENAESIREQIAHLPAQSPEFREFHYAWGAVAGPGAVMFGVGTGKPDMAPALAGWASADPTAAMTWIRDLDMENDPSFDDLLKDRKIRPDDLRNHLMEGIVHGLAAADPDLASRFVHDLADAGQKGTHGMMHDIAETVLRTGSPEDAARWVETLPEGELRGEAMERVAGRYAGKDPEAAAAWAGQFAHQPEAAGMIAQVIANWSSKDPEAALAWMLELPEGGGRNAGMHHAMRQWAKKDLTAAGEYLQTMTESPARDAAVSGYTRRVAWENPAAAMSWAETIASEDQRVEAMIGVGQAWTRLDASAAASWARASGLPAEIQQKMLTPPKHDQKR